MAEVDIDSIEQTEVMDESTSAIPLSPQTKVEQRESMFDGTELPFEVINGIPMYQKDHVVDNRCQIFERIGWDDRVGATYLATAPDGKELVLRVGNEQVLIPQLEASFLCKIEQKNQWRLFSQVHSIWQGEQFYFLALYFRSGPQLSQFLQDTSKIDSRRYELVMPHWCGGPMFAPMTYHDDDPISCRDELEAWLYFFIYLVKGTLPWENDRYDDIKWTKIKSINNGELFDGLPQQFHEILNIITHESATQPVSDSEYDKLEKLTRTILCEIGGVENEDKNFDFERDPTEEEIPRFIVERKPIDEDLQDDITQSSHEDDYLSLEDV
ncbi:hypothetical protein DICVIV_01762 [Dictyocaulus viviparus]|uniref:Protein kinase domain-containing protein n=1 Tax=Dictyocaulus viviparus TaxID=29172 RepID=A0A0D8Y5P1_DICVI|nr:hypothetical protein DICVIV_01762 [Dictyocaulus viviparus]